MSLHTPDLTKFPPRSPRVRLGGYAILPRCLDKGRATLAGKQGEYHYACPLDQHFLEFAGVMILAVFAVDLGAAFVEAAGEDDIAAEADARTARRLFGQIK